MSHLSAPLPSDPTLERSFRGHKAPVTSVSFSPSLRQLASGGQDHLVMIWNFKPQLRAFRFIGHKGVVTSVEFSPTGHLLASASTDNTVRLWEPTVRGKCSILKAHSAPVRSVSWSSDAKLLITASDDKTCKIWGSSGARFWCSLVGHTNWVRAAVLSRDTRLAASASDDKTVKLWDVQTHQCVQTYYEHNLPVRAVKFHPHGSVVASAGVDNSIKLYDLRSHQMIQHYTAHDNVVNSIDFHPSGDYLLSGSDDSTLKIWDLREGHQLYTIHGHKGATTGVTWSPEGDFFASAGADQRVMTWATNFDKVPLDPTLQARRKKVHIQPSSAEKLSREQYEGGDSYSARPATAAPSFDLSQQGPRTIHADALPGGYATSTSFGQERSVYAQPFGASGQYHGSPSSTSGVSGNTQNSLGSTSARAPQSIPQPQPHPELAVSHDCAYDHDHHLENGSSHSYHSSQHPLSRSEDQPLPHGVKNSSLSYHSNYPLPADHQQQYPPPANAPVQNLSTNPNVAGPRLLQSAGADLNSVRLPDQLTSTLHHIVTQLDVISKTVKDMEERLALHETKLEDLEQRAVRRERDEQHQLVLQQQASQLEQERAARHQ